MSPTSSNIGTDPEINMKQPNRSYLAVLIGTLHVKVISHMTSIHSPNQGTGSSVWGRENILGQAVPYPVEQRLL